MSGTLRVIIDFDQCEANALCTGVAPEVFDLDDDDQLSVLLPHPPEELWERVRQAARVCPKQAISIEQNPGTSRT